MARLKTVICLSLLLFLVLGSVQASPTDKGSENINKKPTTEYVTTTDAMVEDAEKSESPTDQEKEKPSDADAEISPDTDQSNDEDSMEIEDTKEDSPTDAGQPDEDQSSKESTETGDNAEEELPTDSSKNKDHWPSPHYPGICGIKLQHLKVEEPGCKPNYTATIVCSGYCQSYSIPNIYFSKNSVLENNDQLFNRNCQCCTAKSTLSKNVIVELDCGEDQPRKREVIVTAARSCDCKNCLN